MSKKMPIIYSALMLTGVNLLLRFASTSFQIYLSRKIGAAGIGLLQLVLSVGSLAIVAGMGGVRTATMYLTAEELGKKRSENIRWVLSGCVIYSVCFSGSVSVLMNRFAPWIAACWIGNPQTEVPLRLFGAFLPVNCLCGVMTGYFTAANRIGTLAIVEVAEQLCAMSITLAALALWGGSDPIVSALCVILGSAAGSVLTLAVLVILRLREKKTSGPRLPIRSRLLHTALPLAVADDFKSGISTLENLMVPKRLALNPAVQNPLSAFGTVSGLIFPVIMFPSAILFALTELLIPELARCNASGSKQRIQYLVQKSLRVTVLYAIGISGIIFLLSGELCVVLYKNPDASDFLRYYALLIPMLYCDLMTDALTKGLGQQKICVRYNIVTSVLDVIFLYFLLPRYGMGGYFFSFFITHLINFLLSLRRLHKITSVSMAPVIAAKAMAALLFSMVICSHCADPVWRFCCFTVILGASLFLLRVLDQEDIRWIRGLKYVK